ncbi:two-component system, sensor histidine kinase YesM [Paenibacillus sp. yr247]|uniref:cache domain-containing sensor histidine kinase n=1 Tax=Paenibacillus sp. yr247 TaxID=1761880 RepID=UPI0008849430|nr:sensor histidine kinase [Paenibacillus sp. yr247]SDO39777.1 two-component system, sensor histidine kinase YesM [Paenibacillus sp. yr247]
MRQYIRRSLQVKLTVMILLSTTIPLFLLGAFSFFTSARISEEKTKQTGMDALSRIQTNVRFITQEVEDMSIFLTGDKDVQQYMSGFDYDSPERERILTLTTNLIQSKAYISNISIYSINKTMPLHTQNIYFSNLSKVIEDWNISGKKWTTLYLANSTNGPEYTFSFLRAVKSTNNFEPLGFICISINVKELSGYFDKPNFGVGEGDLLLLDTQGIVMSGNRKDWLSRHWEELFPGSEPAAWEKIHGTFTYGRDDNKQTVLYQRIPDLNWTLVGLVPYELYTEEYRYIWLLTGSAVSLAAVLTFGLNLFFIRHVTKPLKVLRRLLVRIDPNEPIPLYQFESPDEVGQLVGSYNQLGEHIKRLKERLIKMESRKKEADIRALQAQINPHFLYNTLSSVHWIALISNEHRIAEMVGALSDFLRFSLNKGNDYCSVGQEILHVKNYAVIQSIRFPNTFDLEFDIDHRIEDLPMLKLLLQPLVENAMIHGMQKAKRRGTIYVSAVKEDRVIRFSVLDDGVGMPQSVLDKLIADTQQSMDQQPSVPFVSYGLRNVNERLLLHYGPSAELAIESQEDLGTRVSFIIPVKENRHENYDRR